MAAPHLSQHTLSRLGVALRQHYEAIVTEPLPEKLADLLGQLRAKVG